MPSTIKEWVEVIVPIASLIVAIWFGAKSLRLQTLQIKATMAALEASETPSSTRFNWFKRSASGFLVMCCVALGWLLFEGLFVEGPVTRSTLLTFSVLVIWFIFSALLVTVYALCAALAPIAWIKR